MKAPEVKIDSIGAGSVDHLGIVVPDLSCACAFYRDVLRCPVSAPVVHDDQGIAVAFVAFANVRVELLAPTTEHSPIRDVLEDHTINDYLIRHPAGGLHHVAYVVDDLLATRDRLTRDGYRALGTGTPIIGASGLPILFLDPKHTSGVLIELKQAATIN